MEVSFLQVADGANVSQDGKLNVLGMFDRIGATNFPVAHPELYVVIQFTARASEYGRRFQLTVKLLDQDGQLLIGTPALEQAVPQGDGTPVKVNTILKFANIIFQAPGTYEISVLIDNDTKGELPLTVFQAVPPVSGGEHN